MDCLQPSVHVLMPCSYIGDEVPSRCHCSDSSLKMGRHPFGSFEFVVSSHANGSPVAVTKLPLGHSDSKLPKQGSVLGLWAVTAGCTGTERDSHVMVQYSPVTRHQLVTQPLATQPLAVCETRGNAGTLESLAMRENAQSWLMMIQNTVENDGSSKAPTAMDSMKVH